MNEIAKQCGTTAEFVARRLNQAAPSVTNIGLCALAYDGVCFRLFCVPGLPTLYNLSFLRADQEVLKLQVERYVPSLSLYPKVHIARC